jgi:hypothetical protein
LNRTQPQLFHQVLFQSWPAGIQPRVLNQWIQYNNAFAMLTGCLNPINVTTCLRGKTADHILQASTIVKFDVLTYPDTLITVGFPWQVTLGLNSFLLESTNINFMNSYASQITMPVFWGTNVDETWLILRNSMTLIHYRLLLIPTLIITPLLLKFLVIMYLPVLCVTWAEHSYVLIMQTPIYTFLIIFLKQTEHSMALRTGLRNVIHAYVICL